MAGRPSVTSSTDQFWKSNRFPNPHRPTANTCKKCWTYVCVRMYVCVCVCVCMYEWMNEWTKERRNEETNERMNDWTNERTNEWTKETRNEGMKEGRNEWITTERLNDWTNERTNKRTNEGRNEGMKEWRNEGMKEWRNEWLNDWLNDWMTEWLKKHCHTAHVAHKPAFMEWGIHSSPTWMIAWPPHFNKAFETSKQYLLRGGLYPYESRTLNLCVKGIERRSACGLS